MVAAALQASSHEWVPDSSLRLPPLEPHVEPGPGPQAGAVYACGAGQLPMPTMAGDTAWRLVATYPLGGPCSTVMLYGITQLPHAKLTLRPGLTC